MGYRKVYLTIEEEEAIERIKAAREGEGRPGAAYNAILKEGLGLVQAQESTRTRKGVVVGTTNLVVGTTQSSQSAAAVGPRRRRRRASS